MSRINRVNLLITALSLATVAVVFIWESGRTSPGPLSSVHRQVPELAEEDACDRCHGDAGAFDFGCGGCHETIFGQIEDDSGFHGKIPSGDGSHCGACHIEHRGDALPLAGDHAFRQAGFVDGRAGYDHLGLALSLTGRHAQLACRSCHPAADEEPLPVGERRFLGLDAACAACHRDHHGGSFGADCGFCHGQERPFPEVAAFRHPPVVPLTGAHRDQGCVTCHPPGTPHSVGALIAAPVAGRDCVDCHEDDYLATRDPDHRAVGYPRTCRNCHGVESFRGATFSHDRFPLTGAHGRADCSACHAEGAASDSSPPARRECIDCHGDDYLSARRPDHAATGFPRTCGDCHDDESFAIDSFTHLRFPLLGAHTAPSCEQCHPPIGEHSVIVCLRAAPIPRSCVACHDDDFSATRDPDHVAAGFPRACQECHGFKSFGGGTFFHAAFPLTGAHRPIDCAACHPAATPRSVAAVRASPLPDRACAECHEADFRSARDPDHGAAGFPRTCRDCHGVDSFAGAKFVHREFPLDGAHRRASCAACHQDDRFAGTPRTCMACHADDYRAVRRPDHSGLGFPYDCRECHGLQRFSGAVFRHRFPIDRGEHRALRCTDCHEFGRAPGAFSCTNCHAHRRGEMDDEHRRVRGYRFDSASCYRCHPLGEEREDD